MIPIYVIVWLKINNAHGKGLKAFSMRIFLPSAHKHLAAASWNNKLSPADGINCNTSSKKGAGPF